MMGLTFINDTPVHQFLAGSAAGAIQCVICCPMELAKTRMQLQGTGEYKLKSKNYKNSLDCLVKIYRKEGLKGINKGMVSTFLRETPSFGFYFLTYDCLTRYLGCEAEDSYIVPKLLLAGGMSGIVSWLSTYPVDVIKSRLQADGVGGVVRYQGILDCIRKSYRDEGPRVFTRGLTSTLLRAFPSVSTYCRQLKMTTTSISSEAIFLIRFYLYAYVSQHTLKGLDGFSVLIIAQSDHDILFRAIVLVNVELKKHLFVSFSCTLS
uniref:Mitochondrial basic amino acids transporter n=1 Tax=Laticauda laticaudata TaxID=8630 RepID=A0A8C5SSK7_LATLA